MGGFLERFPDNAVLVQGSGDAVALIGTSGRRLTSLGAADGPLGEVLGALGTISGKLDIDVSGLARELPDTIARLQAALPPTALDFVGALGDAYRQADALLGDSELARALASGTSLGDAALAAIEDALALFDGKLADFTGGLVDARLLAQLRAALTTAADLQASFPAHAGELVPFVAQLLVGVAPELLRDAGAAVERVVAALAALEPAGLAALDGQRARLHEAGEALAAAIDAFDPADPAGYAALQAECDALQQAVAPLTSALAALFQTLAEAIAAAPWHGLGATYRSLLDAIQLPSIPTLDDVVAIMAELLASLSSSLDGLDAGALATRLADVTRGLREGFAGSGPGRARQALHDFLADIRTTIEGVPIEAVVQAATGMLGRVQQELDALGVGDLAARVHQAFTELDQLVSGTLDDALGQRVREALGQLLAQLEGLPLGELTADLAEVMGELGALIDELAGAVSGGIDDVQRLLDQLQQVSFTPIGDAAVAEIEDIKRRLQQINPAALSSAERVALQAALALLRALAVEGGPVDLLEQQLEEAYAKGDGQLRSLLGDVAAALKRLRDNLSGYSAEALLRPIEDALAEIGSALAQVNGALVIAPLQQQGDRLLASLDALAPGALLAPLGPPYAQLTAGVARLDPRQWLAPLQPVFERVDRLVASFDLAPLLGELDRRERALLASARDALVGAIDAAGLPDAVRPFVDAVRALVAEVTDALFADPDGRLRHLLGELRPRLEVATLFAPLDAVFDRLLAGLAAVPPDALVAAVEQLRTGLGLALGALEPWRIIARVRAGAQRLAELDPALLLAPLAMPSLAAGFAARAQLAPPERQADAAAVTARLDALTTLVDVEHGGGAQLTQQQRRLAGALQHAIAQLDFEAAASPYARLRAELDRRLPPLLLQAHAITAGDLERALQALRPSAKAAPLDRSLDALALRLTAMQGTLGGVVDDFFAAIRAMVLTFDPVSLEGDVHAIFLAVRDKVKALDPAPIALAMQAELLAPVQSALQAIDPARLAHQLDAVFQHARDTLAAALGRLLADLTAAIDGLLRSARAMLAALTQQLQAAAHAALGELDAIVQRVEELVLVELIARLQQLADKLEVSFAQELARVRQELDAMLAASPGGSVSITVEGGLA